MKKLLTGTLLACTLLGVSAPALAADAGLFAGRQFSGVMINNADWNDLSIGKIPYGLYNFKLDKKDYSPVLTDMNYEFMAAAYGNGCLVGVRQASFMGALTGVFNYDLSISNPEKSKVTIIEGEELDYSALSSVMTYSPLTNTYYSVNYNADLTALVWSRYDRKSERFKTIAPWPNKFQPLALAVGNDDTIWCIGADGYLYTINPKTGAASMTGELGIQPALNTQCACYDGETNSLVWAAQADKSGFYSVDLESGNATLISEFKNSEQFACIYPAEYTSAPTAPLAISDLSINYVTPGSLSGNYLLTLPSSQANGKPVSSDLTVDLYVDGERISSQKKKGGSRLEMPFSFKDEGMHYVAVTTKNAAGYSAPAFINSYAGYDVPLPVSDVVFNNNEGKASLTWKAPTSGENDGYVDFKNLSYNVVRMPQGVTVASGLTKCEFSETLPDEMRRYFYKVTALNGPGKMSQPAESNFNIWGSAYPVPFIGSFGTKDDADIYSVVNSNNDKNSWNYSAGNKEMSINTYQVENSNDWLISPAIRLEKEMLYQGEVDIHTFASGYPENIKLLVGTDPTDLSSFTEFADFPATEALRGFEPRRGNFSVPANGRYYVAVQVYGKGSSMVRLNGFCVNQLAPISAPDGVADLSVTSTPSEATVSFMTPTKALDGAPLSKLNKVVVERDGRLAGEVNAPAPGKKVEVKITLDQPSISSFVVYAISDEGNGLRSEVKTFVGEYKAPYVEDYDNPEYVTLLQKEVIGDPGEYEWNVVANDGAAAASFMSVTVPIDVNVYTPNVRLDDESVYEFSMDWLPSLGIKSVLTAGQGAKAENQIQIADLPELTEYGDKEIRKVKAEFVADKAGLYNVGIASHITEGFKFVDYKFDNVAVRYVGSAFAPNAVTDLKSTPDAKGELNTRLTFVTPTVDYSGRPVEALTRIDIYRGLNSAVPVKSFENPQTGSALEWIDETAAYGFNDYVVVAYNARGRGKAANIHTFVGEDIPMAVRDLKLTTTDDNLAPVLSWKAPEGGRNGGVINPETLSYSVMEYFPATEEFKVVAEGIKDTEYTGARTSLMQQSDRYFGIVPVSGKGNGMISLDVVVIGKPLALPYRESFPNGKSSTSLWMVTDNNDEAYWTETPSEGTTLPDEQDGDNGMAVMFNSTNYGIPESRTLISPVISLANAEKDIELSFWYYTGLEPNYNDHPTLQVLASGNHSEMKPLLEQPLDLTSGRKPGWKQIKISLADFSGMNKIQLAFIGTASGYQEPVLIDNIDINGTLGINSIAVDLEGVHVVATTGRIDILGAEGMNIAVADAAGRVVASVAAAADVESFSLSAGIYVVNVNGRGFITIVR